MNSQDCVALKFVKSVNCQSEDAVSSDLWAAVRQVVDSNATIVNGKHCVLYLCMTMSLDTVVRLVAWFTRWQGSTTWPIQRKSSPKLQINWIFVSRPTNRPFFARIWLKR